MSFKHLFCAAAVAPLCFAASAAFAQTSITTTTATPLKTSTAGDIDVASGTLQPATTETAPAITLDSNGAKVTVTAGNVLMRDQPSSTGVEIQGGAAGRTFTYTQSGGVVRADDTVAATDTDNDGDIDGDFATGGNAAVRYGVRLTGPGTLTGDFTQTGGLIAAKGNNGSSALSIETNLVGNVGLTGAINVLGSNTYGVRSTGAITGNVTVGGTVSAIGLGATGVSIENGVTGTMLFSGAVTTTGFRYVERPNDTSKLDADDLLIGGPAVRLSGAFTKGIRFQAAPLDTSETNTDEDGDGVLDSTQTTSSVSSYGSAPAVLIGGSGATTLGNVGTASGLAYGLVLQGAINGFGVYDGVNAQGLVLSGQGGTVDTGSGVLLQGTLLASSVYGNATAIRFGAGATAPLLNVTGKLAAGTYSDATRTTSAVALQIDSGATLSTLVNSGVMSAGLNGPKGTAVVVRDLSGTLGSVTNYGTISASINTGDVDLAPVGDIVALDLRNNTTGVTVNQLANPDPAITTAPAIAGDILFGSGNDTLNVAKGSVTGAVAFGGGSNTLSIASGASVYGDLTNTGGLNATVNGSLSITNAQTIPVTTLATGTDSTVGFTADQKNAAVSQLAVANTATLGSGTKIQLGFKSKLNVAPAAPYAVQDLVLIHANGGLVNNGYDTDLAGDLPYLYTGALSNTAQDLILSVRRRTATELGLQGSKAAAFDAFYQVFDTDTAVATQVFAQTNATDFNNLYSQFLPDYGGGPFHSVAEASRAVARIQAEEPKEMVSEGARSWLQEIAFGVDHTSNSGQVVYDTAGFGVAGGIEHVGPNQSTVGYSFSFATSDIDNSNRAFGSNLTASTLMASLYWRKVLHGIVFDVSGTAGYSWFDGKRRVVGTNAAGQQLLARDADANWSGATGYARAGASYEANFGRFYARPEAFVDYIYLNESGYTETGGGTAINLTVDSRTSTEAAAQVGLALGARFGRSFHWGPELSVAYRMHLAGELGDTNAYFSSLPGQPFTLSALAADKRRLIVRAALRGYGAYANFSLEGSAELGDLYDEYMGRMVVRFLF